MKCNNVKGNRLPTICYALFMALSVLLLPSLALAIVNTNAHWPVEVTLTNRNSVYGTVTGLNLSDGDSIGMFDADGNCHGAGLYRGNYYALTAFMHEEADPTNPADQTIEGFVQGEEVFFKVYQESTGEEYVVTHSSGNPYKFSYKGLTPLTKINLVYEEEADDPSDPSDPNDPGPNDPDPNDPPPADPPASNSIAPMGTWALAPQDEDVESTGPPPPMDESVNSKRDKTARDVLASEPDRDRYAASSPSSSYGSSVSRMSGKGSGKEGGQIFGYENHDDDNDAYRRIEDIINTPFKNRAGKINTGKGLKMPRKSGMPMPLKLFLLFVVPGLILTGTAVKLWIF